MSTDVVTLEREFAEKLLALLEDLGGAVIAEWGGLPDEEQALIDQFEVLLGNRG